MAQIVGSYGVATFTSPSNGDTLDATVVKGNDNNLRSAYVSHDADGGLHLQSSSLATRSSAGTLGRKWLTTDASSYRLFFDDGSAWYELSYLSTAGGTITGNLTVTGTITGAVTGNASTATALQTARTINGTSFNGTADITVTAAAGTLTGATLASGVTASSLTSVGTLASLNVTGNVIGIGALVAGGGSLDRLSIQGLTPGSGSLINSTNAAANAFAPLTFDATVQKFNIASTERMRLDASGNLGLGVTPSAWASGCTAFQLDSYSALFESVVGRTTLAFNARESSSGSYAYLQTEFATMYQQVSGVHSWYIAPSGTAGNAISFTQAMTLDASGNLGIGTSSPSSTLTVVGGATITSSALIGSGVGAADAFLDIGANRSANGYAYIDLVGDTTYTDFGLRLARNNTGANTNSQLAHRGTGDLQLIASDVGAVTISTQSTERARVKSTGQVRFVPLSADPAGAETGDVYYNSSTNKLRVYNGAWVDLH